MNILVFSDSHGRWDLVEKLLKTHPRRDGVIFLGDGVRDISYYDCIEGGGFFAGVCGNCDGFLFNNVDYDFSEELRLPLSEYTVIAMHGHTHGVKSGIERALVYAAQRGGDILLFGHTHVPFEKYYPKGTVIDGYELQKSMWAFNPGSLGHPIDGRHTYGLIGIKNGQVLFSHGEIK